MSMKNGAHFWRAIFLLALVPPVYLFGRPYLVPDSFGKAGFYRYDALGEAMAIPVQHQGDAACAKCHTKQGKEHAANAHKSVRCESCHAPIGRSGHVLAGKKAAAMPMLKDFSLCLKCHQKLTARAEDFPQINLVEHLKEVELEYVGEVPRASCFECHSPHDPSP